jgi:hypothetical protein
MFNNSNGLSNDNLTRIQIRLTTKLKNRLLMINKEDEGNLKGKNNLFK